MYPPHLPMLWPRLAAQQRALCSDMWPSDQHLFLPPFPTLLTPSQCDLYCHRASFLFSSFFTGLLRMVKDCIARRKCLSTVSQTYLGWVVSVNGAVWLRGARSLAAYSPKDLSWCVFCSSFVFRHWMWIFPWLLLTHLQRSCFILQENRI